MKTHILAEQALQMLIEDYKAGKDPTTYGQLARRCGFEGQQNARWFGQVTDLIDAACALAGVPSFALVRAREANRHVNHAAWRKEYSHLRDRIIATALAGSWADEDFTNVRDALAVFSANGFGNKRAWNYVWGRINMEAWAGIMSKDQEIEFETPLEEDVESIDIPTQTRTVYTDGADPEIASLHGKAKRGKLVVQPDFQRHFVWDNKKASRLIESALLSIPIPIIYISEEPDNKEYVIDGQQRLTSFFSFLDGKFPDGADFRLTGLNVFQELNGKKYDSLPEKLQDTIQYFKLRTVTFKRDSDPDLKFEIFERLNTGSVQLNDQELRNCIYRGGFNNLLRDLSEDPDFTFVLGLKQPDKRMKDIELVLRFAAFHHETYLKYKSPMRNFLNREAEQYRNLSDEDAAELRTAFKNACQVIRSMFGEHAFKRFHKGTDAQHPAGYWEPKKFNASLYDILMYTLGREEKNVLFQNLDSIREALIYQMTENQAFIDAIELSTSSVQAVTKRFDIWRSALKDVIGMATHEPRCFTRQLKEALYAANNTCAICGQKIEDVDDSAVDHIKQYWMGGKTIPENARLAHRFCNWSRPRNEAANTG
jgi:Protein of unknown function DUF262/HNH endonuclease